jgi:hypothetical protein
LKPLTLTHHQATITQASTPEAAPATTTAIPAAPVAPEVAAVAAMSIFKFDVNKRKGEKLCLNLTIQEEDKGYGLLRFFGPTSREEYDHQSAIQFEQMAEKQEELRISAREAATERKERLCELGRDRQQRYRASRIPSNDKDDRVCDLAPSGSNLD